MDSELEALNPRLQAFQKTSGFFVRTVSNISIAMFPLKSLTLSGLFISFNYILYFALPPRSTGQCIYVALIPETLKFFPKTFPSGLWGIGNISYLYKAVQSNPM